MAETYYDKFSLIYDILSPDWYYRKHRKFAIMDWYITKPSLRAEFIKWIGGGEVDRPLYQYSAERVDGFSWRTRLRGGDIFVVWGSKVERL